MATEATRIIRAGLLVGTVASVAALPGWEAHASPARTQSGSYAGLAWQARSAVVGATSTATLAQGGSPIYVAPMLQYSGTIALVMDYGPEGVFTCSGTLLPDRRSILTAAHCVSDGTGSRPVSTTAWFYGGPNPDTVVPGNAASTSVGISDYFVSAGYTGEVIDDHDVAVLRLVTEAPAFASSYDLYDGGSDGTLTGEDVNLAGYGMRSSIGGALGFDLGAGRLRQGDNHYAFRWGDPDWGGYFLQPSMFGPIAAYSYVVDFDSGTAANDAACKIANVLGQGGAKYCETGRGATEAAVAPGDSGGPNFVDGRISGVNSYILSFGETSGDVDSSLNGSFGEFSGMVPVYLHAAVIRARRVASSGQLESLRLKTGTTAGCRSVTGTVTLSTPAPAEGIVVTLRDTLASASVPETLTIPPGATTKTFRVKTVPVSANESGAVTATLEGKTVSQTLTVRPMGLQSLTLKPTTVAGSQPVTGTAKLECAAGPGPVTVDLSSSRPAVAYPVATSIVVPQGVRSVPFAVATETVLAKTYAMITGEANGTTKTRKLNVTPAAEVSPRSLKFGNVTVGSASGPLSTILTNKGTSAFFIDSIGITGSYASWFSQTSNCPSSLPAGASCTISVKFKPAAVAKRSAKLSIVTSATSTPLSVSLSGTGI